MNYKLKEISPKLRADLYESIECIPIKKLTHSERIVLKKIISFEKTNPCTASNSHISVITSISETRVSTAISSLRKKELIDTEYTWRGKKIESRAISVKYNNLIELISTSIAYKINKFNKPISKSETPFESQNSPAQIINIK